MKNESSTHTFPQRFHAGWRKVCEKVKMFFKPITDKISPVWNKTAPARRKISSFCSETWKWAYRLRSILLSIPVVVVAIILAIGNMATLPASVMIAYPAVYSGVLLFQEIMVSKSLAVFVPLVITAFCLLMMLFSKRPAFCWLVSVFSLLVPIFLRVAVILPA